MNSLVIDEIRQCLDDPTLTVSNETVLLGEGGIMDSMRLVELCLRLEDHAVEMGFDFDWTSESAMSQSRGMFRTVGALQEEFQRQCDAAK